MDPWLISVISDPLTGESLTYLPEEGHFYNKNTGATYPSNGEMPVLLPASPGGSGAPKNKIHRDFESEFNYIDHYQKDAVAFDYFRPYDSPATRHELRRLHETILAQVPSNVEAILDAGCGNGWVAGHFMNKDVKIISMDISDVNPSKALQAYPFKDHFGVIGDVFHIPFKKEAFDCVIASEIMEHVPDPCVFIKNLLKTLKKGGKLIITTPYDEKIEYHLCVHCNKPTPENAHLHSFNESNISQYIPEEGTRWMSKAFINKYMLRLRTHIFLKYLPFGMWSTLDRMANFLSRKPVRFLVVIEKQ